MNPLSNHPMIANQLSCIHHCGIKDRYHLQLSLWKGLTSRRSQGRGTNPHSTRSTHKKLGQGPQEVPINPGLQCLLLHLATPVLRCTKMAWSWRSTLPLPDSISEIRNALPQDGYVRRLENPKYTTIEKITQVFIAFSTLEHNDLVHIVYLAFFEYFCHLIFLPSSFRTALDVVWNKAIKVHLVLFVALVVLVCCIKFHTSILINLYLLYTLIKIINLHTGI